MESLKPGGQSVGQPQSAAGASGDQSKKPRHPPPTNRKRTKTGCLTCRKRRIKCDEGRPTCNNCIKSKRICEGPFGTQGYIQGTTLPLQLASQQARRPGTTGLPTIAPRPPAYDYYNAFAGSRYHHSMLPGFPGSVSAPYEFNSGAYPSVDPYAQQRNPLAPIVPFTQSNNLQQLPHSHGGAHTDFQQQPQPHYHPQNPQDAAVSQYFVPTAPGAYAAVDPFPVESNFLPAHNATSFVAQSNAEEYDLGNEDASSADSEDDGALRQVVATQIAFQQNLQSRSYHHSAMDSFSQSANDSTLGQYMSTPHAHELRDEAERKLFQHFMRVTGPTMSLYERHPFDPAEKREAMVNSHTRREPKDHNIWSHTFPTISLHHPGLLNAILALASLQVAHIQGVPATAAHKHYHVAIRRVAKNVKSPSRRLHPATLAATLLLAYFEVWNSEHTRWASHLYGARTLFQEMPLRDMGRRCLPAQSLRARQSMTQAFDFSSLDGALPEDPNKLDYGLLTAITGFTVTADDYGLRDAYVLNQNDHSVSVKDIETFENVRDLFWWYCKMDVYQTMLGGTKLFMSYEHWTQCPPRGPVAKMGGIYGTYDHLILLLGRLAQFASNDLARKRLVSRAKGPAPGGSSPPPFPGMLPTEGTFRTPMGFSPPRRPTTIPDLSEDSDPQESYRKAEAEWEGIRSAFRCFQGSLGPEFQPLSREYVDSGVTPFGQTEQYRTFSVAGIWMNFYMGLIHLHRNHPSMPPTAMQSVGFAATTTAEHAKQIGRIAIGLRGGDLSGATAVNTVLAAALVESAFCLFVAAVQYQDDAQRQWVVSWMHNITRLTGWKSARQIADGCESAWTKAAQLGKGPPYERQYEPHEYHRAHGSVWDNARRIDRVIQEIDYDGGHNDRRIVVARAERAHYALGLLGVEDDMEYLELKDETFLRESEGSGRGA